MSWLNLNQSLNSLKGQITNIASEVFSENTVQEAGDDSLKKDSSVVELEEKCRNLEFETVSLKKLVEELKATLQSERLSRRNGVKEEESNWYWDPSPQSSNPHQRDTDNHYKTQIRALQDELSTLKERDTVDLRPDEELRRLREENQNLTSNLEDLDSQHQLAMERLLTLKKELQKNFESLKQEHQDLKNTNDEYAIEVKQLLAKIGERDRELENIKTARSDHESLIHKYQNLERVHGLLRENAEKFQEENQELHEEVFKLQEKVTKLEHDIEIVNKQSETSDMVSRQTYEDLLKEINDLKDRRNSNQIHLDEINIDDNAKSVIDSLRREISELKHKLSQKENQESGDGKTIRPEKVMQLYNKYVNFELPIDYVGEIPSAGDNIILFKLESVFKTVHSFKKEIDGLEHKLSEKNLNVSHLQTQIDDLTTENDFLTTDIRHVERELSEMKKNNDFLISEIAVLKNTSKLEPIIETHEDNNLAKLETELADCNKLNKNFETEIKRIEKELAEVRTEKISLKESLNDLRHKYTTMLSEFDMYKNQTKEVEELENSTKNKESEMLRKSVDEINDLKKHLQSANAKNEQLSIDIHVLENEKELLKNQVDDLRHNLKEKCAAHSELVSHKTVLENKIHEFESMLEGILNQEKEVNNTKSTLEEKVTLLERELSSLNNASNMAEVEIIITEKNLLAVQNVTLMEEVNNLKTQIENLERKQHAILKENKVLKSSVKNEDELKSYKRTIDELNTKIIEQDVLSKEVISLKAVNQQITERKLKLEAELSATDHKIVNLEQEFEKLIADLNEKDMLIDGLNSSLTKNQATLSASNQIILGLENSLSAKNEEVNRLRIALEDVSHKFNDSSSMSNVTQEEVKKLQHEKEEFSKTITSLNDEVQVKNNKISALTLRIEELEKSCSEHKTAVDNKIKEIKELRQSIVELTEKVNSKENITHEDQAKIVNEKEALLSQLSEFRDALFLKERALEEMKEKHEQSEQMKNEFKTLVDKATAEKSELINLINLKHNESIQYHNEIQRLNGVVLEQANEFKKIIEEKEKHVQSSKEMCANCDNLKITLKEKDEIIIALNLKASECDKVKSELVSTGEAVTHLKERCENLDKNLAVQLETVKTLTTQNAQLSEQGQNAEKELERLRRHLVETEENYTQELMVSEQKLTECQSRLHQVEERAKQTSTVYTSNSIRANQEVETLRNQIKLLEKQRDEVQVRLSEAEDAKIRSEAALTNLQVVLEQFQLDKERDIHSATEKIRKKMDDLRHHNNDLHKEIVSLNTKLEEALAGLQAATRLGDQVETKTAQINDLKEQVRTLQTSVTAAEERYYNAISNQQDKVDKNLVKNLVINYVLTAAGSHTNKTQVLRVLSTVLDFNQQECERLGLVRSANTSDSLAAEFVKFLQNESRPRAPLPNMMTLAQGSSRSTTPSSRKNSTIGAHPNLQSTITGHSRNPSTGSNNLLFTSIDTMETASQRSRDSDRTEPKVISPTLDTGVNQTRAHPNLQSTITGHSRNPSTGSNNLLFTSIDTMETASQRSRDSDRTEPKVISPTLDTGVNQTRNSEGAILKSVLKDM